MKRIRLAIILVAVVIILTGIWWFVNSASSQTSTDILTSGFIEANDVSIALEIGGRIVNITVKEGDEIEAGEPLVKLDDSLIKAQQQQTEAVIAVAQAGLQQAVASLNQAIVSRDGTKKVWQDALDVQANPLELEARIIAAQGELDSAELDVTRAFRRQEEPWGAWEQRAAGLRRDIAEKVLQNLLDIKNNPQEINAALDQAYVAYQTAIAAGGVAEQAVEVAKTQIKQAEASLAIIEVQLSKLTCRSPISGVVAAKHAEVGEIAQAGAPILTVTQLEEVTLNAYVPESRIGWVKLGQKALVSVDSYPDESFAGEVIYVSPRALFTPGNIQLKEEREKTVFAVKIRLDNPEQKLKPGMPADARILTSSGG